MGSSYLVGRVLSIKGLYNSLTLIPFLIYFFVFWSGVTFPLVALNKILSPFYACCGMSCCDNEYALDSILLLILICTSVEKMVKVSCRCLCEYVCWCHFLSCRAASAEGARRAARRSGVSISSPSGVRGSAPEANGFLKQKCNVHAKNAVLLGIFMLYISVRLS